MVFPYLKQYQATTGAPTVTSTTCPNGEWQWIPRWGNKPTYTKTASVIVIWFPFLILGSWYAVWKFKEIREQEQQKIRRFLTQNSIPNDSEFASDIDDIYTRYKDSKLEKDSLLRSKGGSFLNFLFGEKGGYSYVRDFVKVVKGD